MRKTFISCMGTAALVLSSSAFAAGITPPDYTFMLIGGGNLVKNGNNGWVCTWTFNMKTDPSVGGTPPRAAGGTMTGGTATGVNCSIMTVDPTTFTITSSNASGGAGVFHGLNFKQSGWTFCSTWSNVPFQYVNNGTAPSDVSFNSASIGSGCVFSATLKIATDLNVVP